MMSAISSNFLFSWTRRIKVSRCFSGNPASVCLRSCRFSAAIRPSRVFDVRALQLMSLLAISALVGVSTALVGPTSFLGFIVANISYQITRTYRHRAIFITGSLIAILLLVFGEFLVEHIFSFNTTLNVIIEFTGGCYFIGQILYKRNGNKG